MANLVVRDLVVERDGRVILNGCNAEFASGRRTVLWGRSGVGKSTLLTAITGLISPRSGAIQMGWRLLFSKAEGIDVPPHERNVGFVFQSFNLVPRTSALENVELTLIYAGVSGRERLRRARESLEIVGLAGRERNMPNQLSGGQQQRVALARALVNNPSIILADEPTGALDTRTSVEVMEIFQRLNRDRNLTLIIVTHEPDIAQYADRIIQFRDGRVRRDIQVENRKDASEVLRQMPPETEDDNDEDEPIGHP